MPELPILWSSKRMLKVIRKKRAYLTRPRDQLSIELERIKLENEVHHSSGSRCSSSSSSSSSSDDDDGGRKSNVTSPRKYENKRMKSPGRHHTNSAQQSNNIISLSENRKPGMTVKRLASSRDCHESSSSRSDVNDDNANRSNTHMNRRVIKPADEMKVRRVCSGASTDAHLYGDGSEAPIGQLDVIAFGGDDEGKMDTPPFDSRRSSGSDDDMSDNEGGYDAPSSSSPAFAGHRRQRGHADSAALHRFRRFANASLDSQGGFASLSDTTTDNDTDRDSSTMI